MLYYIYYTIYIIYYTSISKYNQHVHTNSNQPIDNNASQYKKNEWHMSIKTNLKLLLIISETPMHDELHHNNGHAAQ